MSKKKKRSAKAQKAPEPPKKSGSRNILIIAAVAVVAVVAAVAVANGGSGGSSDASNSPGADQYLGRFLPEGYEAPKVADLAVYSEAIKMTEVAAAQDASGFTVPVDTVIADKIVRFDYTKPDGESLPMIAYVRPSGGLFVGVSYCPPCEGEGQRIEADGTLTCESCGTRRNLETNAGLSGACKAYPLDEIPSTVVDGNVVVDTAVLDSWTPQPLDRPVG